MRIIVSFIFLWGECFADTYSFIMRFRPNKVTIFSPSEYAKKISIIVENNTLNSMWAKVIKSNGAHQAFLGIPAKETRSIIINNYHKDQVYYFISESPPFQKIALKFKNGPFEIPPTAN